MQSKAVISIIRIAEKVVVPLSLEETLDALPVIC